MFLWAKSYLKKCSKCGTVASRENDGFCHNCKFFFKKIGNRWFDDTGEMDDFSCDSRGFTFPR